MDCHLAPKSSAAAVFAMSYFARAWTLQRCMGSEQNKVCLMLEEQSESPFLQGKSTVERTLEKQLNVDSGQVKYWFFST